MLLVVVDGLKGADRRERSEAITAVLATLLADTLRQHDSHPGRSR